MTADRRVFTVSQLTQHLAQVLEQQVPPTLFMPHAQAPPSETTVEVRTAPIR